MSTRENRSRNLLFLNQEKYKTVIVTEMQVDLVLCVGRKIISTWTNSAFRAQDDIWTQELRNSKWEILLPRHVINKHGWRNNEILKLLPIDQDSTVFRFPFRLPWIPEWGPPGHPWSLLLQKVYYQPREIHFNWIALLQFCNCVVACNVQETWTHICGNDQIWPQLRSSPSAFITGVFSTPVNEWLHFHVKLSL